MKIELSLTKKDSYHELIKGKVDDLQSSLNLTDKIHFEINLILDEICTNIFIHNSANNSLKITINIENKNKSILLTISDNGKPFDPTTIVTPNINLPLEERQPGGLGIFLVKKYSSALSYERQGSTNKTVIEKIAK